MRYDHLVRGVHFGGYRVTLGVAALALVFGTTACATAPVEPAALKPQIIPHSAWEAHPPVGYEAEATRRNLAPGDSLQFQDISITLVGMQADPAGDHAQLVLRSGTSSEQVTIDEGAAVNWGGLRITVLAVHASAKELGAGLTEMEIATMASLPADIAATAHAGDATRRLRIPHEIRTITLHHSGSAEPLRPGDDPVEKLRGLQAWGQADKNWWDVPYHFLIDLEGNIYEGRDYHYMGETNTTYNPRGHFLISVLGNYDLQEPTPMQIEAITDLMAWAVAEFNVPLDRIYGHGDLTDTSCPGEHLRKYLDHGTFREGVRARLEAVAQPGGEQR